MNTLKFPRKEKNAKLRMEKKKQKITQIQSNMSAIFDKSLTAEQIKDGRSAYEIVGSIVSGSVELSEDLIKSNAVFTPASRKSGKLLNVAHNYELGTASCAGSELLAAAAYRITIDKNKEITGSQLTIKLVAVGKDAESINNTVRVDFDKEEDENKIEIVIVPYVRDSNSIDTPVFPVTPTTGVSEYISVSGIVVGMKVTIETVSAMDLMNLD